MISQSLERPKSLNKRAFECRPHVTEIALYNAEQRITLLVHKACCLTAATIINKKVCFNADKAL